MGGLLCRVLTSRYTCVSLSKGYEWIAMYGSPPIKSLEKHKWNIRIVRAKINSEKIELETSYEKSNEI